MGIPDCEYELSGPKFEWFSVKHGRRTLSAPTAAQAQVTSLCDLQISGDAAERPRQARRGPALANLLVPF